MRRSKPLDLVEKWRLMMDATTECEPRLASANLAVLSRLLDHQNTKTGQCNPSQARLSRDLCLSRRTVQKAVRVLLELGFIWKLPKRGVTNSYGIRSRDALRKKAQDAARTGAVGDASEAQQSAHKTIKETLKKKQTSGSNSEISNTNEEMNSSDLQEAEKRLVKELEHLGYRYEQLLLLPTDLISHVCERISSGAQTAGEAAREVAAEIRKLPNGKDL